MTQLTELYAYTKTFEFDLCVEVEKVSREFIFSSRKDKTDLTKLNHWVKRNPSLIKPVSLDLKKI